MLSEGTWKIEKRRLGSVCLKSSMMPRLVEPEKRRPPCEYKFYRALALGHRKRPQTIGCVIVQRIGSFSERCRKQ